MSLYIRHGKCFSLYKRYSNRLVHLDRTIHTNKQFQDIDAYPNIWLFAFADFDKPQVTLEYEGKSISLYGKMACLIPPFSVVKWTVKPGRLRFRALIGESTTLPSQLLSKPSFIPLPQLPQDLNEMEIIQLFQSPSPSCQVIGENAHILVQKTKELIDKKFLSACSIKDIASELKIKHATMTRHFTQWYGIPPLAYRNKLRVFYSKFSLLCRNEPISSIAFESGFEDLATFNKQFKKTISGVPSQFRLMK